MIFFLEYAGVVIAGTVIGTLIGVYLRDRKR